MVLTDNVEYFENWKLTTTNYSFISLVNLKLKREYTFQGDYVNIMLESYNEKALPEFIDWFYANELELSVDHENYELTPDDLSYMLNNKEFF